MQEYKATQVTGRVPPAAALQQQIANARPLVPLLARPVIGPLLDVFAAYVAATDAELQALRAEVNAMKGV
jgi:hypothetical protein